MSKRPMSEIGRMLECDIPSVMPVLPLMSTVVFPLGVTSIQIRLEQSKALLRDHSEPDRLIALVYSPAKREGDLNPDQLSKIGLAARIIRILNKPSGNVHVTRERLRLSVAEDVVRRTSANVEKNQREFFLRQQLTEIRRQLGDEDPQELLVRQILDRADGLNLPPHVHSVVYEEANRLRYLAPTTQEAGVLRTYIEWLLSLPWDRPVRKPIDLDEVTKSLDAEHFGLDKVKERILEYLA